ncbi:hypothetical protein FPQ18DRAFT_304656 [Pyronema domesticum]|nr:hypothetical protein FPQ18DRAFT_304656 [Pyronema domesticum]
MDEVLRENIGKSQVRRFEENGQKELNERSTQNSRCPHKRSTEHILKFLQDTEVGNRTRQSSGKNQRDELCRWEELMEDSWDEFKAEEEEDDEELLEWEGNVHIPNRSNEEDRRGEEREREMQEAEESIEKNPRRTPFTVM